jgi:hypothetical protein
MKRSFRGTFRRPSPSGRLSTAPQTVQNRTWFSPPPRHFWQKIILAVSSTRSVRMEEVCPSWPPPDTPKKAMNPSAALTLRRYPVGYIGPVNGPYPTYGQSRRERCRHTSGRRVGISHEGECDRLEPRIIRSSSRRMPRSRSLAMRPRPPIRCSKRTVRRKPGCVQLRFQIFTWI